MTQFPKLYHPDSKDTGKTLTPCTQVEYEGLLRIGWKVKPESK